MSDIPACWTWPVGEAEHERAYLAATDPSAEHGEYLARLLLTDWQAGRCAACGYLIERLFWDHSHDTGYVRGLLCRPCNNREPRATGGLFGRYRARPAAAIVGVSIFYEEPDSRAAIFAAAGWLSDADVVEALARHQAERDPARRRLA